MKINTGQSVETRLQTNKTTPRKDVTVHEEIEKKDKAILDVKFGKDKDEVFLMGKHLKFIKNVDNAAGFAALAAGAAIIATPLLLGLGATGSRIVGLLGGSVGMFGSWIGASTSQRMLHDKIKNASTTSEERHYESLLSDKVCIRHHGLTISSFGVAIAGIGAAGGPGGIVLGGIAGLVTGMIAASQHGWPESK